MKVNRAELMKFAGFIGAALAIGGYLRYLIQEAWDTLNTSVVIAGLVLLVLSLAFNFSYLRSVSRKRSARLGANTAVVIIAVLAILGVANFLGYRHHKRIDLTEEKLHSLSDQTRKIVSSLQKDVKVLKFDKQDDQQLQDLMKEYRDLSSRLTFERVDPQVRPDLVSQYKVQPPGELLVIAGERIERPQGAAEQQLTNAILKVTRDKQKKVFFVEGHGEKSLAGTAAEGYSFIQDKLQNDNYQVSSVNLVAAKGVPGDCDVLVLPGPKQALFPQEAAMIGKYLDGGGKALLMIDPDTDPGVNDVLKAWDVQLGDDVVVDSSALGQFIGTGPAVPLARSYGSHLITENFDVMTFFPIARSVSRSEGGGGGASNTELVNTSEESFAETELKGNEASFDEGKDKRGPLSLAIAGSKPVGEGEARLAVFGDSDFAANGYARSAGNGDLFLNTVNWLAQEEDLISIRPKSPTDRRVNMTESNQNLIFWLSILLMPGVVIASGVYVWWKRK